MLVRILRALLTILKNLNLGSTSSIILVVICIAAIIAALIIAITPFVIAALVNFVISWQMASAVKMKGHNFIIAFLMCFILTVPGYFYAIALPDVTKQKQLEKIINTLQTEKESASNEVAESTTENT